jgi:hypothetical protein
VAHNVRAFFRRSAEAVAIVHALNARVGWLSLVWEYYGGDHRYVQHLRASGMGTD